MRPGVGTPALRRSVRSLTFTARRLTAQRRVLPDFLIIGAQKAGSTSLYAYLSAHPQVLAAARKEVHFFDINYERGEGWYRAMFPLRRRMRVGGQRPLVTGEASPYYLFHPLAPERAAALVPRARLIVLLRDPVERAWSHYSHEVAAGREMLPFAAALDAEPARLNGSEQAIRSNQPGDVATFHRTASYVSRGRYADQLRSWLAYFPRDRMLIVKAEDLFEAPEAEWSRVAAFLDLSPGRARSTFAVHNRGGGESIPADARARLVDAFAEPNRDLASLLGTDFGWTTR